MQVCKATVDDVEAISRIYALSWKTAYKGIVPQAFLDAIQDDRWVRKFRRDLGDGTLSALIVSDGDTPAGCAAFGRSRDDKLPDWGEVVSIYLHPDYYGKGYGEKLLNETMRALEEQEFVYIYLWVLRENHHARRFYERNGFVFNGDECSVNIMDKALIDLRYVLNKEKFKEELGEK